MVDLNLVAQKLKELSLRIAKVQAQCPAAPEGLAEDGDLLDLVSFNLFLAVQACIDLATHLIADEGWNRRRQPGRPSNACAPAESSRRRPWKRCAMPSSCATSSPTVTQGSSPS